MTDLRTPLERKTWDLIGPPLYYCAECMLRVKVTPVPNSEPIVKRDVRCEHTGQIIAPRKATLIGKGGMSVVKRVKTKAHQTASSITGRSV